MKKLVSFICLGFCFLLVADNSFAAVCEASAGPVTCPANNLCVGITHATTDTDGAPMAMASTELTIGNLSPVSVPVSQAQYNYVVPKNTVLPAGTLLSGVTLSVSGVHSVAYECTTPQAVKGRVSVPSSPTLKVSGG